MTLGQVKFRITKDFPGVDIDLIEGWIADRVAEILDELPWQRLQVQAILQVPAAYTTGTVDVTNGSSTVTGTGTTFTADMTGRSIRIAGRNEYYQFTQDGDTSGTLDRAYEGPDATGAGFKIFKNIFPLDSDCRLLQEDAFAAWDLGQLRRIGHAELNAVATNRLSVGAPRYWATYMDDDSWPPKMQIELYPNSDTALSLPYTFTAEATTVNAPTATPILAWMQPSALIEGVNARICRHLARANSSLLAVAMAHEAAAAKALSTMRNAEANGSMATEFTLSNYYTSHRSRRSCG